MRMFHLPRVRHGCEVNRPARPSFHARAAWRPADPGPGGMPDIVRVAVGFARPYRSARPAWGRLPPDTGRVPARLPEPRRRPLGGGPRFPPGTVTVRSSAPRARLPGGRRPEAWMARSARKSWPRGEARRPHERRLSRRRRSRVVDLSGTGRLRTGCAEVSERPLGGVVDTIGVSSLLSG